MENSISDLMFNPVSNSARKIHGTMTNHHKQNYKLQSELLEVLKRREDFDRQVLIEYQKMYQDFSKQSSRNAWFTYLSTIFSAILGGIIASLAQYCFN